MIIIKYILLLSIIFFVNYSLGETSQNNTTVSNVTSANNSSTGVKQQVGAEVTVLTDLFNLTLYVLELMKKTLFGSSTNTQQNDCLKNLTNLSNNISNSNVTTTLSSRTKISTIKTKKTKKNKSTKKVKKLGNKNEKPNLEITKKAVEILNKIESRIISKEEKKKSKKNKSKKNKSKKDKKDKNKKKQKKQKTTRNPMENPNLFEGDIILSPQQAKAFVQEAKDEANQKHVNLKGINTKVI
uniref:Uncharacterized protein n=1 Tax=Strongyloides stercoralis TaxID=6248 RepID=A0A0K0E2F6_STRER